MQAQDIAKKKYIGRSFVSIICAAFIILPDIFVIVCIFLNEFILALLLLIISYVTYLEIGIRSIGKLIIDGNKINIKRNFAPEFLCFQKEINIELKDIAFIEFVWVSNDAFEKILDIIGLSHLLNFI